MYGVKNSPSNLCYDTSLGSWGITFSERAKVLTATGAGAQCASVDALPHNRKNRIEWEILAVGSDGAGYVGVCTAAWKDAAGYPSDSRSLAFDCGPSSIAMFANDVSIGTVKATASAVGDIIDLLIDQAGKVYGRVNGGNWNGSATVFPHLGNGHQLPGAIGTSPLYLLYNNRNAGTMLGSIRVNTGQQRWRYNLSRSGFYGPNETRYP